MEIKRYVTAQERETVAQAVLSWINGYTNKPVKKIAYEFLSDKVVPCMSLSAQASPYKSKQYIDGSYQAIYQFYVYYRARPTTDAARLAIDESLDRLASWCMESMPDISGHIVPQRVECTQSANMVVRYDDGTEDHSVALQLIYEVI